MRRVFVLLQHIPYEGAVFEGVYSTRKKAFKVIPKFWTTYDRGNGFWSSSKGSGDVYEIREVDVE